MNNITWHGTAWHGISWDVIVRCAVLFCSTYLSLSVCVCLRVYCVECVRRIGFVRMEKRRCRVCLLRRCVRCAVCGVILCAICDRITLRVVPYLLF